MGGGEERRLNALEGENRRVKFLVAQSAFISRSKIAKHVTCNLYGSQVGAIFMKDQPNEQLERSEPIQALLANE